MTTGDILFWDNLIESATLTASSEALDVDNLKTPLLFEKWRSTGKVAEYIHADFGSQKLIRLLHLQTHNLNGDATLRVRISANSDMSSPVYDNTFYAWPSIYGYGDDGYGDNGYGGTVDNSTFTEGQFRTTLVLDQLLTGTLTDATTGTVCLPSSVTKFYKTINTNTFRQSFVGSTLRITGGTGSGQSKSITGYNSATHQATVNTSWTIVPDNTSTFEIDMSKQKTYTANSNTYAGRYLRIDIANTTNSNSYLQIGYLGAGDYFQPAIGSDLASTTRMVDPSTKTRSIGGSLHIGVRTKFRTLQSSFTALTEDEAKKGLSKIAQVAGGSKPVVYCRFTDNSFRMYSDSIYGYFTQPPDITQIRQKYNGTSYGASFNIEEQV